MLPLAERQRIGKFLNLVTAIGRVIKLTGR